MISITIILTMVILTLIAFNYYDDEHKKNN
jgi:hypothetical protein